jgi:HAD superfamily hydrolase (TIGR01509 family)
MARQAPRRLSAETSRGDAAAPVFPSALSGVVFDVDGTLLDSNDAHARSWIDTLREFRFDVRYERVRSLIGVGGDKLVPAVTGLEVDSDRGRELTERRSQIFKDRYLPTIRPTRGAHELVRRLRDADLQLVIATSAQEDELESLLRQGGLESLIPERTTSSDAEHSKPDPDIVQAALRRAELDPERAVMVGDTPYDIEAAMRAGVRCIALRCGGWWDDDALRDAVAIFDDPHELLSVYERQETERTAGRR